MQAFTLNKKLISSFIAGVLFMAVTILLSATAGAATITVTTTADRNDDSASGCSLAEAVHALNNQATRADCPAGDGVDDTIIVPTGTYVTTDNSISIYEPVTIEGDQNGETVLTGGTRAGLYISATGDTVIRNITVQNSGNSGFNIDGQYVSPYTVTLENTRSYNNGSSGVYHSKLSGSVGSLYINDSVIEGNSGIGLSNDECQSGETVYITNTLIRQNGSGIRQQCGSIVMDRVTVANNESSGVFIWSGSLSVTNSTIYGNNSSETSGTNYYGGITFDNSWSPSEITIVNTTIANNEGAGLAMVDSYENGSVDHELLVNNTIIANNSGNDQCLDLPTFNVSTSNNLSSDESCSGFELSSTGPMLGVLADNGGSAPLGPGGLFGNVLTASLLEGSPAIGAGSNDFCPAVDERNITRPQNGTCDIGAYEFVSSSSEQNGDQTSSGTEDTEDSDTTSLADTGMNSLVISIAAIASISLGFGSRLYSMIKA